MKILFIFDILVERCGIGHHIRHRIGHHRQHIGHYRHHIWHHNTFTQKDLFNINIYYFGEMPLFIHINSNAIRFIGNTLIHA